MKPGAQNNLAFSQMYSVLQLMSHTSPDDSTHNEMIYVEYCFFLEQLKGTITEVQLLVETVLPT